MKPFIEDHLRILKLPLSADKYKHHAIKITWFDGDVTRDLMINDINGMCLEATLTPDQIETLIHMLQRSLLV